MILVAISYLLGFSLTLFGMVLFLSVAAMFIHERQQELEKKKDKK